MRIDRQHARGCDAERIAVRCGLSYDANSDIAAAPARFSMTIV